MTRSFVFNGDNKQVEVKDVNGVTIGRYFYDGEGKRVKKVTDTETTIFVYSSGKLVAEYSTQLSQTPSVAYTTTDHLGTPRVISNEIGQVKARRDFMPFGEELFINVGARSAALNYSTSEDDIRQKFTGYQKDSETGLDFAEARMYENRFGRFTAVDPLLASGKSANPQTFNRYVYVGNNPIVRVDKNGMDWMYTTTRVKSGDSVKVVYNPVWVPGKFPRGVVPREQSFEGRWDEVLPYVYQIAVGENEGQFAALDPNSGNSFVGTEREARLQFQVYTGEVSEFDAKATRMAWNSQGNAASVVTATYNHPQFAALERVTNPDGVSFNIQAPFGLGGVGGFYTKDGFYGSSFSPGGITATDFVQGMRDPNFNPFHTRNLLGGVSISFPYITGEERDMSARRRLEYFTGRSATITACYYFCGGTTVTAPDNKGNVRTSINPGFGLPSAGGNVSIGKCAGSIREGVECPQ